jgi:serine/threonine protein phosphatase PrpC
MTAVWNAGAATDTGRLRERNEDRCFVDAERGVFLVVDGLGGQAAGELAAETAVQAIRESLAEVAGTPEERVRRAITTANNRIFELSRGFDSLAGMACVLTLALLTEGELTVGHVGDSRLYLVRLGEIRKITADHSPVGEVEDAGDLTEEEAMRHPRRHEVFRDVGSQPRTAADQDFIEIQTCRVQPDMAVLLCSDGLSDELTSAELRCIAEQYDGDASVVAQQLIEAANEAGGRDNITAVFVAGPEFPGNAQIAGPRFASPPARLFTGRIAFLAYGILIGMLLWAVLRVGG